MIFSWKAHVGPTSEPCSSAHFRESTADLKFSPLSATWLSEAFCVRAMPAALTLSEALAHSLKP